MDYIENAAIAICQRDAPEIEGAGMVWRLSPPENQNNYRRCSRAALLSYRRDLEAEGVVLPPLDVDGEGTYDIREHVHR